MNSGALELTKCSNVGEMLGLQFHNHTKHYTLKRMNLMLRYLCLKRAVIKMTAAG